MVLGSIGRSSYRKGALVGNCLGAEAVGESMSARIRLFCVPSVVTGLVVGPARRDGAGPGGYATLRETESIEAPGLGVCNHS